MRDESAPASALTAAEANFVHNIEVLGLPYERSMRLAGLTMSQATKPHVAEARAIARREMRRELKLTKEDVLEGIVGAIDRARLIAEPSTEIAGWKQISTMLGYDKPTEISISLRETVSVVQQRVRALPNEELVKLLGADSVIDGEFYDANKPKEA